MNVTRRLGCQATTEALSVGEVVALGCDRKRVMELHIMWIEALTRDSAVVVQRDCTGEERGDERSKEGKGELHGGFSVICGV